MLRKKIQRLLTLVTELEARDGNNCIITDLLQCSCDEICDEAIKLLLELKKG